ncbi:hypothetical protein COV24_05175 [candidate division WWE3 bacterium CG10_big_fil_rev_8_21_14_0_10_32_10]|uniref:Glycosyltransferase RgtA/B/C/D-like domain-containing protein n=1 Tax=candidate division WWE3 bacterium CG10_big_fil_rev_8_21_14_0_10_32_10 TaxID=1975090 RepID=A0A2H0RB23_UNCKA|nr:MAG: hypothetical protein COV24_05175 [candidate division WWE3 bacterium CG10_big_fil_rev_8_21_14_0_10_32_10]
MFLEKYVVGVFEDNTSLLVFPYLYKYLGNDFVKYIGYPFGENFSPFSNEPFYWLINFYLGRYVNNIMLYNFLIILTFLLTFFVSLIFFKFLINNLKISLVLSVVFALSPYLLYQSRSHLSLFSIWIFIVYVLFLIKAERKKQFVYTGLIFSIMVGLSNYLAYFAFLFTSLHFFAKALIRKIFRLKYFSKKLFLNYFILAITALFASLIILYPFIRNNFSIPKSKEPVFTQIDGEPIEIVGGSWKLEPNKEIINSDKNSPLDSYNRSMEDFFYFTSRPWYYFLPSPENPWFGRLTTKVIDWLQNDWGYWLTSNYFPSEHTASYLGIINFIFAVLGVIYIIKKVKSGKVESQKLMGSDKTHAKRSFQPRQGYGGQVVSTLRMMLSSRLNLSIIHYPVSTNKKYLTILTLGLVGILLSILTLPPYFTISLHKIYMPSYLLWKIFPMFRVLARLGILILLIELVYTGYGYVFFLNFLKKRIKKLKIKNSSTSFYKFLSLLVHNWPFTSFFLLAPFFVLSLMEFYVPVKITDVSSTPKVFTYIRNNTPIDSAIAVYPYSKTNESVFWMREYMRRLVNPRDFARSDYGFSSKDFTFNLNTCKGLIEARNLGTNYVIYFNTIDNDKSLNFFANVSILDKMVDYKDLYFPEYSAILYRVNSGKDILNDSKVCNN